MNVFARRSFMKALSAAGLGGIVGGLHRSRAFAATGTRKLVMVFASGGWDTTWSIEPKDGTEFDIPVGTRTVIGGLPIWTDPSRPLAQAFFTANAARTCIVNGIEVRSISHPECTRRMLCGLPGSGNPDVAAIAGHTLGADQPIGYLMLGNAGYTGPLAASAGRVGATNQIVALLDEELGYPQLAGDTTAPFVPSASERIACVHSWPPASSVSAKVVARSASTRRASTTTRRHSIARSCCVITPTTSARVGWCARSSSRARSRWRC